MAGLWIPRRADKPPAGARINWAHPLAQGLGMCVPLIERAGAPYELVRGVHGIIGGAPTWTPEGVGLAGNDAAWSFGTATDWPWVSAASWTVMMGYVPLGASDRSQGVILGAGFSSSDGFYLQLDASTNRDGARFVVVTPGNTTITTASNMLVGQRNSLFATFGDNGSHTLDCYPSRVLSSGAAVSMSPPTSRTLWIGRYHSGGVDCHGQATYLYAWARTLTRADRAALHAEPYAFLTR